MKKLLILPLLLLGACSNPPKIAEAGPGTTCLVMETRGTGEMSRLRFALNEADADRFNTWFLDNRFRFSASCKTYAPHRSVHVNGVGRLALTQDEKSLVLTLVREASQALQDQYVLRLEDGDAEILQLLRLKN